MHYQVRYQTVDGQDESPGHLMCPGDEHFAEAETFLDAVLRAQPLYNIRRTERRPFIPRPHCGWGTTPEKELI